MGIMQGRKMSRIFVSAIVLILLAAPILAFDIKPAKSTTILSQSFDDEPTGSVPQGWVLGNPSVCSLAVNDTVHYGGSGKSARYADMASYPGGAAEVARTFEDQHGLLVLSFALMAEVPQYFMFYVDSDHEIYHGANVYFMPYGYIAYYDDFGWHDLLPFSVNTWYRIKMVIDIPKNTYDIYVDDALRAQGARFRYFGQATHLNRINFGGNSWEMPIGFIDEISIDAQELVNPATTVITLTGSFDYLLDEDVKVRLDALVKDANTKTIVSNANVTVQIYYPNGSVWVSDAMKEKFSGTGIYEWESNGAIREMHLEKGVYLVHAVALAVDGTVSTDILAFHIDPPSGSQSAPMTFESYYTALVMTLIVGTILGIILLRRHRKELLKTGKIQIDVT
jgi:hypothetical protein